jgi:hypothetical protein
MGTARQMNCYLRSCLMEGVGVLLVHGHHQTQVEVVEAGQTLRLTPLPLLLLLLALQPHMKPL